MGLVGVAGVSGALGVAGVAFAFPLFRFGRSFVALALETDLVVGLGVGGFAFWREGDSLGAGRRVPGPPGCGGCEGGGICRVCGPGCCPGTIPCCLNA